MTATKKIKTVTVTIDGNVKYCGIKTFRDMLHPRFTGESYADIIDDYVLDRLCCGTLKPVEGNADYTLLKSTCNNHGLLWYVVMNNRKHTSCLEFSVIPPAEVRLNGNRLTIVSSMKSDWCIGEYQFNDRKTYGIYRKNDCCELAAKVEADFPLLIAQDRHYVYLAKQSSEQGKWSSHEVICILHNIQK